MMVSYKNFVEVSYLAKALIIIYLENLYAYSTIVLKL